MAKWELNKKVEVNEKDFSNIHPIALQILFQRGLRTEKEIDNFLFPDYEKGVHDPFLFSDMKKIVQRIGAAKDKQEKVAIFGDYDADGVTSTAVLKRVLEELGISPVIYIPDKDKEGYGMNENAISEFKEKGVTLILTVDCGISNVNEIALAKEKGMDVIIIDHHHIPEELPDAYAIINPKLKDSGYPFTELAGVGTVFKVSQALIKEFAPEKEDKIKWLLDLVAIGTVADCVPLFDENRVFAKYGLVVLSKTRNVGLGEIFKVGRVKIDEDNFPTSHQISFQIAPRINAAGRMDHASIAYNLVMEEDEAAARILALDLEAKNQQRQKATSQVVDEIRIIANKMFKDKSLIYAVSEHFPSGLVGLAAGKISDEFNKPTAVLQKKGTECIGSFRSIPELSIIEAIEECQDLLIKFGGHSQAAGITIKNENMDQFFQKLEKVIEKRLKGKDLTPKIEIDSELSPTDIDFELTGSIKKFEPFGKQNEEPVFLMKNLLVSEIKILGNGNSHLKLFLKPQDGSPKIFESIGFGMAKKFKDLKEGDKIDVVFNLQEDTWNGNKKIQLVLVDLRKV